MNHVHHTRFDCLWDGTFLSLLAGYCLATAYSVLTSQTDVIALAGGWMLGALAVILGLFAFGEYRSAFNGPTRP